MRVSLKWQREANSFIHNSYVKAAGFTLIELLISMSIIFLIASFGISAFKYEKNFMERKEAEVFQITLLNFLNNSKAYCKAHNVDGRIIFNDKKNQAVLYNDINEIKIIIAPKSVKELRLSGRKEIHINNLGYTSDACTISFKDGLMKQHETSICVGSSYAEIKY